MHIGLLPPKKNVLSERNMRVFQFEITKKKKERKGKEKEGDFIFIFILVKESFHRYLYVKF